MSIETLIQQLQADMTYEAQHNRIVEARHLWSASEQADQLVTTLTAAIDIQFRVNSERCRQLTRLLAFVANETDAPLHHAASFHAQGTVHLYLEGDYQQAQQQFAQALPIYEAHDRPTLWAQAQIRHVPSLWWIGQQNEAFQAADEAMTILVENQQFEDAVRLTVNLANLHNMQGNTQHALDLLTHTESYIGDDPLLAGLVYATKGYLLEAIGEFDTALNALQKAYTLFENDYPIDAHRFERTISILYTKMGQYNRALQLYEQLIAFFDTHNCPLDVLKTRIDTSECHLALRQFDMAYKQCQSLLADNNNTQQATRGDIYVNLGVAQSGLAWTSGQSYSAAIESFQIARQLFADEDRRVGSLIVDLELAYLYEQIGQYEEGGRLAQQSAVTFDELGATPHALRAWLIVGRCAINNNQLEMVQTALNQIDQRPGSELNQIQHQRYALQGKYATLMGQQELAISAYEQAIDTLEQLQTHIMAEYRVDFLVDKQYVYEEIVALQIESGQITQALDYAERAKSRALLEMIANHVNVRALLTTQDETVLTQIETLRRRLGELYRQHWQEDSNQSERRVSLPLRQEITDVESALAQAWHTALINCTPSERALYRPLSADEIMAHLDANTLLLEYFSVGDEQFVFLISHQTIEVHSLGHVRQQIVQAHQFYKLNCDSLAHLPQSLLPQFTQDACVQLQQLHDLLIQPIKDTLSSFERLIIVPHGELHHLPFHAFHDRTQFLIQNHAISYLPCAALLSQTTEERRPITHTISFGHAGEGELTGTVPEANMVATLFDGATYTNEEATRDAFMTVAPNADLIHCAMHGQFQPHNPLFSNLIFHDDAVVALDVFDLRLQAELVTLSACQTGQTTVGGGDEILGLARAFLYAGASTLLLSHWHIEDTITPRLMDTFYRHIQTGTPIDKALQHAQINIMMDKEQYLTHPYFWAAFFVTGNRKPLQFNFRR